jgi:hypothetical protein
MQHLEQGLTEEDIVRGVQRIEYQYGSYGRGWISGFWAGFTCAAIIGLVIVAFWWLS